MTVSSIIIKSDMGSNTLKCMKTQILLRFQVQLQILFNAKLLNTFFKYLSFSGYSILLDRGKKEKQIIYQDIKFIAITFIHTTDRQMLGSHVIPNYITLTL